MAHRDMDPVSSMLNRPTIALVTAICTIAVVVALRTLLGGVIDDPVLPITYLGVVGGIIGAFGMVLVFDALGFSGPTPAAQFWARVGGDVDPVAAVGPGMCVHFVYGALAGGLYPRLLWWALEDSMITVPGGLLGGLIFGTILFLVAVVYHYARLYRMVRSATMLARYYAYHLVYGVVLGLVVGSYGFVVG